MLHIFYKLANCVQFNIRIELILLMTVRYTVIAFQ